MEIWSVGHGARPLDEFVEILRDADIKTLADVRLMPGSRRHPHFGAESLDAAVHQIGIAYRLLYRPAGPVDDAELLGARQRSRGPADTDNLLDGACLLQRQRERTADQADTEDCDFFEHGRTLKNSELSFYASRDMTRKLQGITQAMFFSAPG